MNKLSILALGFKKLQFLRWVLRSSNAKIKGFLEKFQFQDGKGCFEDLKSSFRVKSGNFPSTWSKNPNRVCQLKFLWPIAIYPPSYETRCLHMNIKYHIIVTLFMLMEFYLENGGKYCTGST